MERKADFQISKQVNSEFIQDRYAVACASKLKPTKMWSAEHPTFGAGSCVYDVVRDSQSFRGIEQLEVFLRPC